MKEAPFAFFVIRPIRNTLGFAAMTETSRNQVFVCPSRKLMPFFRIKSRYRLLWPPLHLVA
ncbi:hypothetical protein ARTHRO9AX_10301 [Arthrobacter sp. 9AX]|nr:hypothetical protein ARTHRO9AX_10301 [Arthrobacter sp. 9AX]